MHLENAANLCKICANICGNFYNFISSILELGGITNHLMTDPSGNPLILFPSNLNVSLGSASGNIEILGNKINCFPRDQSLSV